ncbi:MAG TPA: DUF6760 family protein [Chloroflexota bacterium]|nr:DUF6760 family protein [Chloroflexota bacterium]
MRHGCGGQYRRGGGVARYPLDQLYEEVAYIAYHFHWSQRDVLELEHGDRRRWIEEIDRINQRRNDEEIERITQLRGY